ncbi:related to metal-dependent amidase/aminoacylase/carboxypeptidase [Cephalotrichum gorgonifer]|uniref:Related to metal-dependent amidase/aminoacylase/carboxypeptidase n=1 Tax=Cephalotrichum gorgonifer TaxID=2041049 RepID=A0AAE8N6L8_9PEZI|nr:related to metal-dependent amidase/aminoacylase/carboxypeptidase [Cephalotrichum gorgonifer]
MPSTSSAVLENHGPDYDKYTALYKHFHANPELSWLENETAAKVVDTLKTFSPDFEFQTGIGGTGLFAVLRNGPGKTIMLRADMDALPVEEDTGLDYASTKKMKDDKGELRPVMHACGHDMHVTALLAAAETLVSSRPLWSGIIVFLFQQAEEKMAGAKAMIADGLFTKYACPIPDVVLGQHVLWGKAGTVYGNSGPVMTAADGMKIKVFGRGGHGSQPHRTVDPVVLAAHIILRLQTIVSREVPPGELAVVTVGALNVGNAANIITHEAVLQVSTRSVNPKWRGVIHDAIRRIVKAECEASNSPKEAEIEVMFATDTVDNDEALQAALSESFAQHFKDAWNPKAEIVTASEDFNELANAVGKPYCFWFFGGHDPAEDEALSAEGGLENIATNHSPFFAPVIQPTLKTGTEALVVAALTFLGAAGAAAASTNL